jgi:signal transduction histidine kinase
MPGLVRLRAIMREPLSGGRREPLVFWTAYGAESLLCNVAALPKPAATGALAADLVLVSIANGEPRMLVSPSAPPAAAVPLKITKPSAADAATMQKIAGAIRRGFSGGRTEEPSDPAEASAPAVDPAGYVSKLAHELRTPLSAIAAAAELMKDQRLGAMGNDRYRGYSADIHDNARHALEVINRLLGEAVAEPAAQRLEAVPLDMNALAQSAVSAMRPLAEEAKLDLATELHTQLPRVVADAMTVKQILFNLLTNAVKFTKPGGTVRVVTGLGFDRSVFVAVQDTGVGMSAEAITRALESDVPQQPQRSEDGGHGIGLPLARGLAQSNGARLEIDSALNEGTAVALIFPKDRIAPPAPGQKSSN